MITKKGWVTRRANGNGTAWNKGKKGIFTPEALEKNRLAHVGRKHSDETKKKMSDAHMGHVGVVHTEESKAKIREARKHQVKPDIASGSKFGKLTVVSRCEKQSEHHRGKRYLCLCECGKNVKITGSRLINGRTKDCGCWRSEPRSNQVWEVELREYKRQNLRRKRGVVFNLSVEEFRDLCLRNCFYCADEPRTKTHVGKILRNGIDRIDSNAGYVIDNCVPSCGVCNKMKTDMSKDKFIGQVIKIHAALVTLGLITA